jgi:NAD-dependent dihydropyrimidine dehydrogenase PreA subunit
MFGLRYLRNMVTLTLNEETCNGCSMCVSVCPHGVFRIENRKAKVVDRDACMECGACARNCPSEAVKVTTGTGCALAILVGALRGTEPTCECSDGSDCC